MYLSDEEVIEEMRMNIERGINSLFNKYYRPLTLYAEAFLGDRMQAEDIVQNIFVKFWNGKTILQVSPAALSSYIYKTVRNECLMYLRKNDILRDAKQIQTEQQLEYLPANIDEEFLDNILEAVEKLSPRTKIAIECVYLRNMKYKEAAEYMGITINGIKFLLKEGLKKLRFHTQNINNNPFIVFVLFTPILSFAKQLYSFFVFS